MRFKQWLSEDIESRLIAAGEKHLKDFPDPDYGRLYWNSQLKKVHWVFGDGAGGWKEGEKLFRSIPGVKDVNMADEYSPRGTDWKKLI